MVYRSGECANVLEAGCSDGDECFQISWTSFPTDKTLRIRAIFVGGHLSIAAFSAGPCGMPARSYATCKRNAHVRASPCELRVGRSHIRSHYKAFDASPPPARPRSPPPPQLLSLGARRLAAPVGVPAGRGSPAPPSRGGRPSTISKLWPKTQPTHPRAPR